MQETQVQSLSQENPLEKEMAMFFNILTWRIPWTEEPGRLQSMGSQTVGHDLAMTNSTHGIKQYMTFWQLSVWPGVPCAPWGPQDPGAHALSNTMLAASPFILGLGGHMWSSGPHSIGPNGYTSAQVPGEGTQTPPSRGVRTKKSTVWF